MVSSEFTLFYQQTEPPHEENPKATAHFRQKLCEKDYDAVRRLRYRYLV